MWCAYAFAVIAFISLPQAISSRNAVTLVSWVSQTFLQLVLLSVIIVGQNVLAAAADKRSEDTYKDADAVLHEAVKLQEHLLAQDDVLSRLVDNLAIVEARLAS
jgi:predicted solute-binding protein